MELILPYKKETAGFAWRLFRVVRGDAALAFACSVMLGRARTEQGRARAIRGLGQAGRPAAMSLLLDALDDSSLLVRREAVATLGDIGSEVAVPRLVRELADIESDIRCEAAGALGEIGGEQAREALFHALGDRDARVRNAAVSALGALGGEEVRERLMELFVVSFDSDLFPVLADSLSRLGERSIVEPVLRRLGEYESIVPRLQFLNAVCRALGAGNEFYRILSKHEYARVDEVNRLIRGARRTVRRSRLFRGETAAGMGVILRKLAVSYRAEDHRAFLRAAWEFMAYIQLVLPGIDAPGDVSAGGEHGHLRPFIEAVSRYLSLRETGDIRDEGMVYIVLCITCLLRAM